MTTPCRSVGPTGSTRRSRCIVADTAELTVVIPTIGRAGQLETTLRSVTACRPAAAEVVVVDQSDGAEIDAVVARFADAGVRRVECVGRGIGLALNVGLRAASCDQVLVTHDDCTVAEDWVAAAEEQLAAVPAGIVTGAVLPVGDPEAVPSTIQ